MFFQKRPMFFSKQRYVFESKIMSFYFSPFIVIYHNFPLFYYYQILGILRPNKNNYYLCE